MCCAPLHTLVGPNSIAPGELADLGEEIKYHSIALAASPPDHYVRRMSLFSLGKAIQKKNRTLFGNDVNSLEESLEESIKYCWEALELSRFEPLHTLAISLNLWFMIFHQSSVLIPFCTFVCLAIRTINILPLFP
jgi:hypothetical protein